MYESVLNTGSLSYMDVGYYYCVKTSAMTKEFVQKIDTEWEEVGS